jgi:chromosome segregation ATPase
VLTEQVSQLQSTIAAATATADKLVAQGAVDAGWLAAQEAEISSLQPLHAKLAEVEAARQAAVLAETAAVERISVLTEQVSQLQSTIAAATATADKLVAQGAVDAGRLAAQEAEIFRLQALFAEAETEVLRANSECRGFAVKLEEAETARQAAARAESEIAGRVAALADEAARLQSALSNATTEMEKHAAHAAVDRERIKALVADILRLQTLLSAAEAGALRANSECLSIAGKLRQAEVEWVRAKDEHNRTLVDIRAELAVERQNNDSLKQALSTTISQLEQEHAWLEHERKMRTFRWRSRAPLRLLRRLWN